MVASGSLCATAGRAAEGAPKSITESRDGTFGSFEELPHQLLMVAIGPFIYSTAFSRGNAAGFPGGAFIACALVTVLAEMAHRPLIGNPIFAPGKK